MVCIGLGGTSASVRGDVKITVEQDQAIQVSSQMAGSVGVGFVFFVETNQPLGETVHLS